MFDACRLEPGTICISRPKIGTLNLGMATTLTKENFFWHKLHSLSGIIPIGFYVVQHLTLNSFSLASATAYNGVSGFFYSMPEHVLFGIEIIFIWIPLLFHMLYGLVIVSHAETNYFTSKYKWSQNRMYTLQRVSGLFLVVFLFIHVATTTLQVKIHHSTDVVDYDHMRQMFSLWGYSMLVLYALGVLAASYHLCYGVWNFCIRWGITVGEKAQANVQKLSLVLFIVVTILGWLALAGFFMNH